MWQKQVRICWARKLNSFQPRIFSAQWGREGKIKVNFELRSIYTPRVHLVTKRNAAKWCRKDKNKSIYASSQPSAPSLNTSTLFLIGSYPIITALLGHLGPDQGIMEPNCVSARVDEIAGAGTSRASRQRLKCPVPGCQVTRASQEALNAHIENNHD